MLIKLKYLLCVFPVLCILIYAVACVEAKNAYVEALGEILKVTPANEEGTGGYKDEDSSYVAFDMKDMKFLNLSLKDALLMALHNNYDIRIAKIDPEIKGNDITLAKSVFDPVLTITGERDVREEPQSNRLITGTSGIIQRLNDNNNAKATLEKPIETGAKITLDFDLLIRNFIDPATFQTLNPRSEAVLEAKISQPLLRNAGIFYNRSNIYIARNDKKKSILEFKATAIDVINTVQKAYWELVKAIEELRVRMKSLERAEDLLKKNKIQVEVGTLAPIELLVAEEGVAGQIEGVVVAENDIKDREDDLKQVMNLRENADFSDVSIVPLDKASNEIKKVVLDESIEIALANRPEFSAQALDIRNAKIRVKQQKNQLLPKLDFEVGIRYRGMAGNFGNAIDSVFSKRYQDEFFGVTFEVPIGNREARNNYTKATLEEKQTVLGIRRVEQKIVVEVRKAVRQIKTNIERIRASKKARELAQERLKAEEKKFKVGRSTSLEVIRAQEDLAVREGKATNAIVDYQISLGDFDAVLGIILKNNNIVIEGTELVSSGASQP